MMQNPLDRPSKLFKGITTNDVATFFMQTNARILYCHHNTTSYETHKALDFLYDELSGIQDEVIEKFIGYTGNRYTSVNLTPVSGDIDSMYPTLGMEVINFANRLQDYADQNKYGDISNLAQSISGAGAKYNYLITLE